MKIVVAWGELIILRYGEQAYGLPQAE